MQFNNIYELPLKILLLKIILRLKIVDLEKIQFY